MGLNQIKASSGTGEAVRASITAIRASGSTTITVDSLTNWPTNFIATTGTELADNTLDPSTTFVFAGHKSGSQIVIDTPAPGYTDAGNSVGQIAVIKPSTMWADNIATTLLASLNDDGTVNDDALDQIATGLDNHQVRLQPRISVATTIDVLAPDIDTYNIYELNAQAQALEIALPTGTPNDGDVLVIRLKDDGTSRAITYDTGWVNISGLDSLAATAAGKWHVIGAMYNAGATDWQIISITTEA